MMLTRLSKRTSNPLLGLASATAGATIALMCARGCDQAKLAPQRVRTYNYGTLTEGKIGKPENSMWLIHRGWVPTPSKTQRTLGTESIVEEAGKLSIKDFGDDLILDSSPNTESHLRVTGKFYKNKSLNWQSLLTGKPPGVHVALFELEFSSVKDIVIEGSKQDQVAKILEMPKNIRSLTINLKGGVDTIFIKKGCQGKITINSTTGEPHIVLMDSTNNEHNGSIQINSGESPVKIYRVEESTLEDLHLRFLSRDENKPTPEAKWKELQNELAANTTTNL